MERLQFEHGQHPNPARLISHICASGAGGRLLRARLARPPLPASCPRRTTVMADPDTLAKYGVPTGTLWAANDSELLTGGHDAEIEAAIQAAREELAARGAEGRRRG